MTGWLTGRRALVVGAGSGIGRAVVDAFLDEGARVAVLERDEEKCSALSAQHPDVPVVCGDASLRAANDAAVDAAVEAFGGLDVLVNCVGVFDFYRSIEEIDVDVLDEAFDEIFRVNVRSYLHSVKAALPALRESERPAIVLTESTSGYYAGRGGVLYVASKFAVRGLVTALSHDLAPQIRVNGVAPAPPWVPTFAAWPFWAWRTAASRKCPVVPKRCRRAFPCRSPCPLRTTRGVTFSWHRIAPVASPAT